MGRVPMVREGMLWKMFQGLVMFAILSANIHFKWTTNGYIAGAWAFMGAYALTVFPFQIYDWWRFRHARWTEHARLKTAGIPYGWRRHLPWNAVSRPVHKHVFHSGAGRRLSCKGRPDRRA